MFKKIVILFIVLSCFSCTKSVQTPVQAGVQTGVLNQDVLAVQVPVDCTSVIALLDVSDTEQ